VLPINEIAQAIDTTRDNFASLFLQVQVGFAADDRMSFDAVARSADDRQAFAEALSYANLKDWLKELVDAIIAAGFDDGHLAADASRDSGDLQLHAMVNKFAGFLQPHVVLKGLDAGMRRTGKILIDEQPEGTGLLIANDLLLTAWHVVKKLFDAAPGGGYEPRPGAGARLQVVFDDFLQRLNPGQGMQVRRRRTVKAHADWCIAHSECHADELESRLPADLAVLEGLWDYAVIRLGEPIGFERGWVTPNPKALVPRAKEKVMLLQYPDGQSMRLDFDEVAEAQAAQQTAIPKLRFLHYVNALPGSSGGPCFDRSFEFFGIHQGAWHTDQPRPTNRGVPLAGVREHLLLKYGGLPPRDNSTSLIWRLGPHEDREKDHAPVIGCDEFQEQVLHSALLGSPKLFAFVGEKGAGKSFRVDVLTAMLHDADHLKIRLTANAISAMDAETLVKTICKTAGAAPPLIEPPGDINSTESAWVKVEVVPKLVAALGAARGSRLVWLSLSGLDEFDLKGQNASDMLWELYHQSLTVDWLRVVLDGITAPIPNALANVLYRERVREITRDDIELFIKRFAAQVKLELDESGVRLQALGLYQSYEQDLLEDRQNAARKLGRAANRTAANILIIASGR
jgi:hypothetical protein